MSRGGAEEVAPMVLAFKRQRTSGAEECKGNATAKQPVAAGEPPCSMAEEKESVAECPLSPLNGVMSPR